MDGNGPSKGDNNTIRAWRMPVLGDPWTDMVMDDIPAPVVEAGMVRVEVLAADLNFADILQCQGVYQVKLAPPFTPGMGGVGRILEAGDGVDLQPGDVVVGPMADGKGAFAQQALMLAEQCTVISETIDPVQAAAVHVTYGTAWFGLHHRGQLKRGASVLVLAAAGGVGSAAVDLAKLHGCWVIAAASGRKEAACRAVGADQFVDYEQDDWYDQVMALTDGRGVDVVYDPVGGRYFDVARRLVAWEGQILIIGFASGDIPQAPMNHALVKNYSVVGVHMGGYRQQDPTPFDQCYEQVYRWLEDGRLNPLIDRTVEFAELPQALLALQERQIVGRVLMKP
ncbi:MAG: NADPH:quinone oxidoreductase family protein [Pseudomonadota bacterium]